MTSKYFLSVSIPLSISFPNPVFRLLHLVRSLPLLPASPLSRSVSLIAVFATEGYSCPQGYENVRKAHSIFSYVNSHFPPEQTHFPWVWPAALPQSARPATVLHTTWAQWDRNEQRSLIRYLSLGYYRLLPSSSRTSLSSSPFRLTMWKWKDIKIDVHSEQNLMDLSAEKWPMNNSSCLGLDVWGRACKPYLHMAQQFTRTIDFVALWRLIGTLTQTHPIELFSLYNNSNQTYWYHIELNVVSQFKWPR